MASFRFQVLTNVTIGDSVPVHPGLKAEELRESQW